MENDVLEPDPIDNWLIREAGSRRIPTSEASVRIPRPTPTSSETPLVTSGRVRPSLITKLDSFPERRAMFENEDTLGTRAQRPQIVEDLFSEDLVNPDISVPGISPMGISSRPTPPVNTSVGENYAPINCSSRYCNVWRRTCKSPQRPGAVGTSLGTGPWRTAAGGGGGGDDSSSDHSCR